MATPLTDDQVSQALTGKLASWRHEDGKLTRDYEFHHFREAMSFIVRVGFEAETHDHHPEIFNVYNKVTLTLSTHDAGGKVTEKDLELAKVIEHFNWTP